MTSQNFWKTALSAALAIGLIACGGEGTDGDGQGKGADTLDTVVDQGPGGGLMNVGGKLFSIPSPVETALMIRKAGLAYQKELPLATGKADALTSKMARSLALGMYGADMAYVTIHSDGQRALNTLQVIEKLGTALEVSNAFDRTLIERYKNNLTKEDSLLRMSGDAFRAADQYLKTNERDDVSALVIAGGWIESMYLTLSGNGAANDAMATRVAEQKRSLTDLIALIEQSDKEKNCGTLLAGLTGIKAILDKAVTTYTYEEPVTDAVNRITHINSRSTAVLSADQVKAVAEQVAALRSTILA